MLRTLTIALVITLSCINAQAQYALPRADILARSGIRVAHISKQSLRTEGGPKKSHILDSAEMVPRRLATYFFNQWGTVDSVYHYPNDTGYYRKELYGYDTSGNLISSATYDMNRIRTAHNALERDSTGEWRHRTWEHDLLLTETKITDDSIMYESTRYYHGGKAIRYYHKTYDLEQDILTEIWYKDTEIQKKEVHQWIAEDGVPKRLRYSIYEIDNPKLKTHEFDVDSTGMVINKHNGTIFDPFRMHNYFKRHEKFQGLRHNHAPYFKEDHLVLEKEHSELWMFDGTRLVNLYTFTYE